MSTAPSPPADGANTNPAAEPANLVQAIERLLDERKQVERFADENYRRLTELREAIRAENASDTANAAIEGLRAELEAARKEVSDVRQQLVALQSEHDAAFGAIAELEREAAQLRTQLNLLGSERDQLQQQMAQRTRQSADFEELLEAMVAEIGQREAAVHAQRTDFEAERSRFEEELKGLRDRVGGAENPEEMASMIEQVEAEIRQQQEALQRERQTLANERAELEKWRRSQPGAPAGPAPDPTMIQFDCKHCSRALQVKMRLAGLATRCTHCGKMSPVPKV